MIPTPLAMALAVIGWSPVTIITYRTENRSGATFSHCIRDGGARRIDHRHEANKAKVVYLEVDIICVEGKAFGILVLWHEQVAKTWKKRGRK
uniref:Uncharacterized protein n=1 Tax=Poecilia reticulata TaxID=8081 RepID=A0A3P9NMG1_POERE